MPAIITSVTAIEEFNEIRNVLRVPFPEDMSDITPSELPQDRRWKGSCLGDVIVGRLAATSPGEKSKAEKKT